jgi:putative endonuclease
MIMSYFVYVIRSIPNGRLYKGISKNPINRLAQHNCGNTKSTKGYVPWKLILVEEFKNRAEARKREKILKSGHGRNYLKNILDP